MPHKVDVPFDEEVVVATGMSSSEFADVARFTVAAKFFADGKLTAGQAAKLCDIDKVTFLNELPRHGYSISNLGPESLDEEMELARGE